MKHLTLSAVVAVLLLSTFVNSQSCQSCLEPYQKVEIVCAQISDYSHKILGNLVTFHASSMTSRTTIPESTVSSVVYYNKTEVPNLSIVQSLMLSGVNMNFIPVGIKSKFVNLKALTILSSGLTSVTKNNLREFNLPLEYLSLHDNLLTSIDADLLIFNSNLKVLILTNNPIRVIEPEFFTKLKVAFRNIAFVNLNSLACMKQMFTIEAGHDIKTFVWNNAECNDSTGRVETRLAPINAGVQQSLQNEMCLDAKIRSMNDRIDSLQIENHGLSLKFQCKMDALSEKLDKLIETVNRISV